MPIKSEVLTMRVSAATKAAVQACATAQGRTVSGYIAQVLAPKVYRVLGSRLYVYDPETGATTMLTTFYRSFSADAVVYTKPEPDGRLLLTVVSAGSATHWHYDPVRNTEPVQVGDEDRGEDV